MYLYNNLFVICDIVMLLSIIVVHLFSDEALWRLRIRRVPAAGGRVPLPQPRQLRPLPQLPQLRQLRELPQLRQLRPLLRRLQTLLRIRLHPQKQEQELSTKQNISQFQIILVLNQKICTCTIS